MARKLLAVATLVTVGGLGIGSPSLAAKSGDATYASPKRSSWARPAVAVDVPYRAPGEVCGAGTAFPWDSTAATPFGTGERGVIPLPEYLYLGPSRDLLLRTDDTVCVVLLDDGS